MPMLEAALAFDKYGKTLCTHRPVGCTAGYIPHSRRFFEWLYENTDQVVGVAHLHPFEGRAMPSQEDITTFSAIELGLDKRLIWPIVTLTNVMSYANSSIIGTADGLANRYAYQLLVGHPPFDIHWLFNIASM